MNYITTTEIIAIRDTMPVEELRKITNETKKRCGYVTYRAIFETMGYTHSFGDKYVKNV